jgi:hypothetical protein
MGLMSRVLGRKKETPEERTKIAIGQSNYYINKAREGGAKKGDIDKRIAVKRSYLGNARDILTKEIERQPNVSALYIQRAKVNFMDGIRSAAYFDIEEALKLHADKEEVYDLLKKMEDSEKRVAQAMNLLHPPVITETEEGAVLKDYSGKVIRGKSQEEVASEHLKKLFKG